MKNSKIDKWTNKFPINNMPDDAVNYSMLLFYRVWLPIYNEFINYDINITSGYRDKSKNELVGGEPNSQHLSGKAFDFTTGSQEKNKEIFNWIKSKLYFDQLIEYNDYTFIHVSYNEYKNRKQLIHIKK